MILIEEGFDEPITFYATDSYAIQQCKWMRARRGKVKVEVTINGAHFTGQEYADAWRVVDALEIISIEALN